MAKHSRTGLGAQPQGAPGASDILMFLQLLRQEIETPTSTKTGAPWAALLWTSTRLLPKLRVCPVHKLTS